MKKGNREKNKVEENNVTMTHKTEAEKFSSYFETIAENLNLLYKVQRLTGDYLSDIIRNFENRLSIMKIEESIYK